MLSRVRTSAIMGQIYNTITLCEGFAKFTQNLESMMFRSQYKIASLLN